VEALTKADVMRLRQMMSQAQAQHQRGDVRGCTELLFAFHEAVWRIPGRGQTASLLAMLHNQVRLLETFRHMRAPLHRAQQEAQLTAYERLVAAMEAGDASAARQGVRDLIMTDCASLLPLLAAPHF
jgi:DNA-binding GntR family transcriptional regulator